MRLYTIGFTKKSASIFFEILKNKRVITLIDIRLNNKSQLAGFTKEEDLKYFLEKIAAIKYVHVPAFVPSEEILNGYREKKLSWPDYEKAYISLIESRDVLKGFDISLFDDGCLLCSEPTPEKCHRRLLAEYISRKMPNIEIIHL